MMNNKSLIILSGGLDSAVSLAIEKEKSNIELALFFNYGQKAIKNEMLAVKNLCNYFNIKFQIIDLPWLDNITGTALNNNDCDIPQIDEDCLDDKKIAGETKSKVWVPNRNGLFLNIAGSYADSFGYQKIIIGANSEEALTFSDNSKAFIDSVNNEFLYSTQIKPLVIAPLINKDKQQIIEAAKGIDFPFNLIWSCYSSGNKHCGKCESCKRLKRGLERAGLFDIVSLLFDTN